MRGALLALALSAAALAGCSGEPADVDVRAFAAVYEDIDGNRVRVELRSPLPLLGPDGQVHDAYVLVSDYEGPFGAAWGERVQALGPDLRPVRDSGCYALGEGEAACVHHHMDFVPYYDIADYGVGLPAFLEGERHHGLVRIADPRIDPLSDPEATSYFEYRPGRLWPERYVRVAPEWEFEETLLRLVSVETGDPLPPIDAWPPRASAASMAAVTDLFPEADGPLLDVPFTVAAAVARLREHEVSREAMDGACVVGVQVWTARPPPGQALPIPPLALTSRTGSMWIETLGRTGIQQGWMVYEERDALGQTTLQVDGNDGSFHSSITCADREAAVVPLGDFLPAVPDGIQKGRLGGLTVDWRREVAGEGARAFYTVHYEPEGHAHWRSATMHAGTGQWAGFTFLAGDRLDPAAEAEQNG